MSLPTGHVYRSAAPHIEHCERCGYMLNMDRPKCEGCEGIPDLTPDPIICVACCSWHRSEQSQPS